MAGQMDVVGRELCSNPNRAQTAANTVYSPALSSLAGISSAHDRDEFEFK